VRLFKLAVLYSPRCPGLPPDWQVDVGTRLKRMTALIQSLPSVLLR
jgi:hypothetical protein